MKTKITSEGSDLGTYTFPLDLDSEALMQNIAEQNRRGAFICF